MINKTLTIMFVDVQGFTSRTSLQTREENQLFIKEVNKFVEKYVKDKEGKLIKTMGDGFLVTFESPTNAVACGIAIQKEIERRNSNVLNENNWVKFRVGVSTGEVNVDENGDVYGEAVNIAARIQKFAQPNDVFISESTYLAMNKSEIRAKDLGHQKFKNVLQQVRVYQVLKDIESFYHFKRDKQFRKVFLIISILILLTVVGFSVFYIVKIRKTKSEEKTDKRLSAQYFPNLALFKLVHEKKFNEAVILGEKLIKAYPDNPKLLVLTGIAYMRLGDLERARKYIGKAVKIAPNEPAIQRWLKDMENKNVSRGTVIPDE